LLAVHPEAIFTRLLPFPKHLRAGPQKKIVTPRLYFMAPSRYNPRALFDNEIEYVHVPAGKIRRYFSLA
jgi:hypothetical protein